MLAMQAFGQPQPEALLSGGSRVLNEAGLRQWESGDFEKAAAAFEAMIAADGQSRVGWRNLSVARHALGQYEKAEEAARKAVALDPLNVKGRYLLGTILVSESKLTDEALDNLRTAAGDFPDARLPLAILYLQRGRIAEAQRELSRWRAAR